MREIRKTKERKSQETNYKKRKNNIDHNSC